MAQESQVGIPPAYSRVVLIVFSSFLTTFKSSVPITSSVFIWAQPMGQGSKYLAGRLTPNPLSATVS